MADRMISDGEPRIGSWYVVTILIILWIIFCIGRLTPSFRMSPDAAVCLTLAESLQQGRGYQLEDGGFVQADPPLLPAVMVVLYDGERGHYVYEKAFIALCALGGIVGAFWLLSKRYTANRLLTLAMISATAPVLLRYLDGLTADIPVFFLAMIFLAASAEYWRRSNAALPYAILAAFVLGLMALLHTVAIAFYAASVLWLLRPSLWRENWRRCAIYLTALGLIALPMLAAWPLFVATREQAVSSSSGSAFKEMLAGDASFSIQTLIHIVVLLADNAYDQLCDLTWLFFDYQSHGTAWPLMILVLPVFILGLLRRMRKPEFVDSTFSVYLLAALFWPATHEGMRLFLPVLPLMYAYLNDGLEGMLLLRKEYPGFLQVRPISRIGELGMRYSSMVIRVAGMALLLWSVFYGLVTAGWQWKDVHSAANGVILSGDRLDIARFCYAPREEPVTVATSHFREIKFTLEGARARVVNLPAEDVAGDYAAVARKAGITHIAISRKGQGNSYGTNEKAAQAAIGSSSDVFRLIWDTGNVEIYEVASKEE